MNKKNLINLLTLYLLLCFQISLQASNSKQEPIAKSKTKLNSSSEPMESSNRHQEWVKIPFGQGDSITACLVYPEVSGKADSVVVIHENRGLTDWVRTVGDELAKQGYIAICPDMLSGTGPEGGKTDSFSNSDAARQAIYQLDADRIISALRGVTSYVRGLPASTEKVSVMGFCWGGRQSFRLAANEPTLKLAMVFCGRSPDTEKMSTIKCPVYGFYGEFDNQINANVEYTKEQMTLVGKTYEPVIYQGGRRGFLRVGMSEGATEVEKKAAQDAWDRILKLLK